MYGTSIERTPFLITTVERLDWRCRPIQSTDWFGTRICVVIRAEQYTPLYNVSVNYTKIKTDYPFVRLISSTSHVANRRTSSFSFGANFQSSNGDKWRHNSYAWYFTLSTCYMNTIYAIMISIWSVWTKKLTIVWADLGRLVLFLFF